MKKNFNRILALLCALVIVVSGIGAGDVQEVKADSTSAEVTEWTICEDVTVSSSIVYTKSLSIDLGKTSSDTANLSLYVKMTIPDSVYESASDNEWRIKFNDTEDTNTEAYFAPVMTSAGVYEQTFSFCEMQSSSNWPWTTSIAQCRVYKVDNTSIKGLVIDEIKIVYTPDVWTLCKNEAMSGDSAVCTKTLDVTLGRSSKDKASNLALYVKITVPEGKSYTANKWRIKFKNTSGANEAYFIPDITAAGVYEHTFSFSELQSTNSLSVSQTIGQCRVYVDGGSSNGSVDGVVINEMKIVYTPCEWAVAENQSVTPGTQTTVTGVGLRLDKVANDTENIMLYTKMTIPSEAYDQIDNVSIGLYRSASNLTGYSFSVDKDNLNAGDNVLAIPWTEASGTDGASLANELAYCCIDVNANGTIAENITIDSIEVVYAKPYVKEYQSNSWSLYKDKSFEETTRGFADTELGLDLSGAIRGNVALYVNLSIPDSVFENAVAENWRIKMCKTTEQQNSTSEIIFKPNITASGEFETVLLFSDAQNIANLDWNNTINSFRLYCTDSNSSSIDLKNVVINEIAVVDATSYVKAGETPEAQNLVTYDVPRDYLFAGWYTDPACGTVDALEGIATGSVYAKFVRAGVLNMAAQYAVNTEDSTAAVRFITTVDSLKYQKVGFDITINGTTLEKTSTVVYEELYAVNSESETITYKPIDIDAVSNYFNTYTVNGIPEDCYNMEITVQSFWITQDGTKVLGPESTCTVNQLMGNLEEGE